MTPARFFLSVTLGMQLLSGCQSRADVEQQQREIDDWIMTLRDAIDDVQAMHVRGDGFDPDIQLGFTGLMQTLASRFGHLSHEQQHALRTLIAALETTVAAWSGRAPQQYPCLAEQVPAPALHRPVKQKTDTPASIWHAPIAHVYDLPEFAIDLLQILRRMTVVFSRVETNPPTGIDHQTLFQFLMLVQSGLVEQMRTEAPLPDMVEQLLHARVRLLITEIQLHAPLFVASMACGEHALFGLEQAAYELELALAARTPRRRPQLQLVQ